MEVLDKSEAVLSNVELLLFLREEKKSTFGSKGIRAPNNPNAHRAGTVGTLMFETLSSLESGAAAKIATVGPSGRSPEDKIPEFLSKIADFGLTKSEKLMLINHCPRTAVEIHLLIEEAEDRLNEEQTEQILELVRTILLEAPAEEEDGQEDGNQDDNLEEDKENAEDSQ